MSEFTVVNPATEEIVTTVARTSAAETDAAIERAVAAQRLAGHRPGGPGQLLRSFASEVDAHVEELAYLEVAGAGT
jgi:acyl-CoA reductase-like NAD-dependent aldehyde dehydrogenase